MTTNDILKRSLDLLQIVEGIKGAMEHGTWRDDKGVRLKDTDEWVEFYLEVKKQEEELQRRQDHLFEHLNDQWNDVWVTKGVRDDGPSVEWGRFTMGGNGDGFVPMDNGRPMSIIEILNRLNDYEMQILEGAKGEKERPKESHY